MEKFKKLNKKLKENLKKENIFSKIAKALIYLLIFLLPLFFLPWTSNVLDFNKQALLFFLILLALICWLISILVSNRVEINTSFINFPVLILLLVTGLSVIFSLFRLGSFWGWPLPIAPSFLSLLSFVALYFIIVNLFKKEEIFFLLLTLFLSGFLGIIFFLFQVSGKFIFPFDFAKNNFFNTIGTVNSLAIYFSILLILLLPLFFSIKRFLKIILGILGIFFLLPLFLVNSQIAWLVFAVGLGILFTFGMASLGKIKNLNPGSFVALVIILLSISLLFTFFRFPLPKAPVFPTETSIGQGIIFEILKELPLKSLVLGSGPGTFVYNWLKYKSPQVQIDQNIFWSEVSERLITTGILGILTFFFLLILTIKLLLTSFLRKNKEDLSEVELSLFWGMLAGLTSFIVSFLLYPANLSILFLFWLLISFSVLLAQKEKKIWDLQTSVKRALPISFLFILILTFGIGLTILYAKRYFAEVNYFKGLRAWQQGEAQKSNDFILKAIELNPQIDLYWRDLSQISLFRFQQLLNRPDLSREDLTAQAQNLIAASVNYAQRATEIDKNNVANWNILAFVYQNLIGIVGGADTWALNSYATSTKLEPTNPYLFTQIARVYLAKSDLARQQGNEQERVQNLKLAQENLEKAISLRSDYAPARFQLAMIDVRENRIKEAIAKLEELKVNFSFDIGLAFQLGLIYYNDNQFDKAKAEFERAVLLDENYSNARYFLGLIYDREGKKAEAISQFEKIEQLNPDNQEVKKILANLREGKPALEGVVPGQPPVEEKPAEQIVPREPIEKKPAE